MGREQTIYMTFMDDLGSIAWESWSGSLTRLLTLGELGDLGPGAFGALPLGASMFSKTTFSQTIAGVEGKAVPPSPEKAAKMEVN